MSNQKENNMVFVFGSNLRGVHGAGAARVAREKHGAIMGRGEGIMGNSYAIPTKDRSIRHMLPLSEIQEAVDRFIHYATNHPHKSFQVTQIGCGLAGGRAEDIAPMFRAAPDNCLFDEAWRRWLPTKQFWGSVR